MVVRIIITLYFMVIMTCFAGYKRAMSHVILCVAVMMLLSLTSIQAYTVRYSALTVSSGASNMESSGYCEKQDAASHVAMPERQDFQNSVHSVMQSNNMDKVPIGGEAQQPACFSTDCLWIFTHGRYYGNNLTFYRGVILYPSRVKKSASVPGVYNNFDPNNSPLSWNASYWGRRMPFISSGGLWDTENYAYPFTQWVCGHYVFDKSDADIYPTYLNGDPIIVSPGSKKVYIHCGHVIKIDSFDVWYDYQCNPPKPWWMGLIIAVCVYVVVVVSIIVAACCCCYCKDKKEDKMRQSVILSREDNPAGLPSQSQIGMGQSSYRIGDDDAAEQFSDDRGVRY